MSDDPLDGLLGGLPTHEPDPALDDRIRQQLIGLTQQRDPLAQALAALPRHEPPLPVDLRARAAISEQVRRRGSRPVWRQLSLAAVAAAGLVVGVLLPDRMAPPMKGSIALDLGTLTLSGDTLQPLTALQVTPGSGIRPQVQASGPVALRWQVQEQAGKLVVWWVDEQGEVRGFSEDGQPADVVTALPTDVRALSLQVTPPGTLVVAILSGTEAPGPVAERLRDGRLPADVPVGPVRLTAFDFTASP